jgi:hypothetical protein
MKVINNAMREAHIMNAAKQNDGASMVVVKFLVTKRRLKEVGITSLKS